MPVCSGSPDENHWILKPQNSKLWYSEFFAWLHKHDPAQQPKPIQKTQKKLKKAAKSKAA